MVSGLRRRASTATPGCGTDRPDRKVRTFSGESASHGVAFAPDGQTIVTSGVSGADLWDVASGEVRRILPGAKGDLGGVAFSPDGDLVAVGLRKTNIGSGQVLLWDASTGRLVGTLGDFQPNGEDEIVDVAFSNDGSMLAATSLDGEARVFDLDTGQRRVTIYVRTYVSSVAFSPDGKLLAGSGSDGTQGYRIFPETEVESAP